MKTGSKLMGTVSIMLLGLVFALSPAGAQDALPARHVLELQFTAAPTEPPTVEPVGNLAVFKVNPVGEVKGDLEGTFTEHITQVDPNINEPDNLVNNLIDITTTFTIETSDGTIEGYFYGPFYFPEAANGDAVVRQQGHVLSVTGAYTHLFMADVIYDGVVNFEEVNGASVGIGDSGTLIIAPR